MYILEFQHEDSSSMSARKAQIFSRRLTKNVSLTKSASHQDWIPERLNSFSALAEKILFSAPHFSHFPAFWGRILKYLKFLISVIFWALNLQKWCPGIPEWTLGCSWIDIKTFYFFFFHTWVKNFSHYEGEWVTLLTIKNQSYGALLLWIQIKIP